MYGFVSLFSPKFWCPDASWVSGSLNLYLMLLLLSREFFIFQIADVHLLHSATWWRLLGQKYSLTAEVTRLRLRGEGLAVWVGVSDLRQSRRHERMNGSKPSCPSGDPQTSVEVPTPFLRRALPFPSPRPSPSGRGRILRW